MIILFTAAKGGQGTTTLAAMAAVESSRRKNRTLVVDDGPGRAMAAVLGVVEPDPGETCFVNEHLDLVVVPEGEFPQRLATSMASRYDVVIVDGSWIDAMSMVVDRRYLVTMPCYVAMKAFVRRRPDGVAFDGMVMRNEHGRALTRRDLEKTTDLKVVAEIPTDPMVARAVDAGLLALRSSYYTGEVLALLEAES